MLEAASLKTLLARPFLDGWSHALTRTWWTREHDIGLALLCRHKVGIEKSADTMGRAETTLAHRARDTGLILPPDWKELIYRKRSSRTPRIQMQYPYIAEVRGEHADLLAVNALVGRGLPDHIRGDVCQEIMLALWQKEISLGELRRSPKLVRQYIRGVKKINYEAGGYALSLDMPMRDGRKWYDVLPDPSTLQ